MVGFRHATVDTAKRTISFAPGVDLTENARSREKDTVAIETVQDRFTPLQAVAFNTFVLVYIPCMVALAAQRHEYGIGWAPLNAAYLTGLGWLTATLIFQVERLLGF